MAMLANVFEKMNNWMANSWQATSKLVLNHELCVLISVVLFHLEINLNIP